MYRYPKDDMENLIYPMSTEEPTIAGIGLSDNRHLNDLVESITKYTHESYAACEPIIERTRSGNWL